MPTRNVNLTDELDRFVLAKVESGRYENASEVVRAALRTLEREEQRYELKLAALERRLMQVTPAALPRAIPSRASGGRLNFPERSASRVATFRLSRLAEADLMDIGAYTLDTWGEDQTIRYIDGLEACCQQLADNPESGRSLRTYPARLAPHGACPACGVLSD